MDAVSFVARKAYVHRWPHDTPEWDAQARAVAGSLNSGPCGVTASGGSVTVGGTEFRSLGKVGISVPFFKRECRMIFEAQFGRFHAHVHLTAGPDGHAGIFARLLEWRDANFGPA